MSARSWTAPALWRFGSGREISGGVFFRARGEERSRTIVVQDTAASELGTVGLQSHYRIEGEGGTGLEVGL